MENGDTYFAKATVLTVGTFLNGVMFIGHETKEGGRVNDVNFVGITEYLKKLGLKTRYDEEGLDKGDAELLIDNVSGKFSYIIIIEQVERWADDCSVESPLVLEAMAKQPVSNKISDDVFYQQS